MPRLPSEEANPMSKSMQRLYLHTWLLLGTNTVAVTNLLKSSREGSRFCRDMEREHITSILIAPEAILLDIGLWDLVIIEDLAIFQVSQAVTDTVRPATTFDRAKRTP